MSLCLPISSATRPMPRYCSGTGRCRGRSAYFRCRARKSASIAAQNGDSSMQLGMIGLGRMGGNIVRRLMRGGHSCVVYDKSADAVRGLAGEGAAPSRDLADFVHQLDKPRAVWVMLPAGAITHATIVELADLLEKGDTLID